MANRPVFEVMEQAPFFRRINIDFTFYNGFSFQQKQRCIRSLHGSYREVTGNDMVLEVSGKSENPLGIALCAFNLSMIDEQGNRLTVESLFPVLLAYIGTPMRPRRPEKIIQNIRINIFVNHFKTVSE